MSSSIFVDTCDWASLFVNTQSYYSQADQCFRLALQQQKKIVTTNYVVAELVALLNSPLRIPCLQVFEIVDAIKTVPYVEIIHINKDWTN